MTQTEQKTGELAVTVLKGAGRRLGGEVVIHTSGVLFHRVEKGQVDPQHHDALTELYLMGEQMVREPFPKNEAKELARRAAEVPTRAVTAIAQAAQRMKKRGK